MTLTLLRSENAEEAEAYVRSILRAAGGSVSKAARTLGIHRVYFYWILRRMGLSTLPREIRRKDRQRRLPGVEVFR